MIFSESPITLMVLALFVRIWIFYCRAKLKIDLAVEAEICVTNRTLFISTYSDHLQLKPHSIKVIFYLFNIFKIVLSSRNARKQICLISSFLGQFSLWVSSMEVFFHSFKIVLTYTRKDLQMLYIKSGWFQAISLLFWAGV